MKERRIQLRLPDAKLVKIVDAAIRGESSKQISKGVGVSYPTIRRVKEWYEYYKDDEVFQKRLLAVRLQLNQLQPKV